MKKFVAVIMLLLLLLPTQVFAAPEDWESALESVLNEQLDELDLASLETVLQAIQDEYAGYIPNLDIRSVISNLHSGGGLNPKEVLASLLRYFLSEIIGQLSLLGKLIVLAVLCALMKKMQDSLGGDVGNVAYAICFVVLMGFTLQSFAFAIQTVSGSIRTMVGFIYSLLPVLLTLLVSMGAAGSAALFHPLITVAATTVSTIVANTVLPLLYFSGVLYLINSFSDKLQVSKLAGLLRDIAVAVMGLSFTVFIGLSVVQGTAAGVADGIAFRTAKFAVKNFIPVVGSLFSDVFETVAGCSMLLKNGIGLVGLMTVFILCAMPALKIMVIVVIYRLAAAIIQPMGSNPVVDALSNLASLLTVVGAALVTVGVMLFILITIVIGTGNAALSLR
ncbi:MAG: stage III sporulation protein AE [Bacillota bacterium]|nr:MAG: stage III sporulation protein AE [Bacillota bacterium]MBS3951327.1 stage III sporulation protein AE [Peptococcaceae bacterium]